MSSWRTMRPRPAPRAERMANSRWRPVARTSRRLATLAQAISNTSPQAPSQHEQRRARFADNRIAQ